MTVAKVWLKLQTEDWRARLVTCAGKQKKTPYRINDSFASR